MKSALETLQPLGRALMLPIAVLPVAGLLLRFGQPDLLNVPFIAAAGNAIFSNLGLLFAIGVAVGLAKENHGAAGLAGVVCFLVATTGAQALVHVPPDVLVGFTGAARDLKLDAYKADALAKLGVPTGIASGLISGWLYNRFHNIKLPDYLAFFGGRRFVPIAAGFAALGLAAVLGFGWPYIEHGMDTGSRAVLDSGAFGLFIYGVLNRLLIVTGLHHIINNIAWFILGDYHGVTGDLKRFFAGDPTAGKFMAGFFPVMMFGLPAACLAMYHTALPDRRKAIAGLLASMALTAFLTGVTEPIEFSFMFLAPLLYAVHAVLTGFAMVIMNALDIRLGFGFSAGLFDYVINFNKATHPLLLLPVGAVYFALYYGIFRFAILKFDLKTLGRDDEAPSSVSALQDSDGRGRAFADALGGSANLESVDACTTRLRLIVKNSSAIDEPRLKALGARGFVHPSANALQVVLGPIADQVAGEIRAALMQRGIAASATPVVQEAPSAAPVATSFTRVEIKALLSGLGGAANVKDVATCSSRLRVGIRSVSLVDDGALRAAGARGVAKFRDSVHVVIGPRTEAAAQQLRAELNPAA
jgi:N-acetylglucosamine PTS system EIICBA or EIICB component